MKREVIHADNMDPALGLQSFASDSFDAIVQDPPSGINFMGLAWDGSRGGRDKWIAWLAAIAREELRVLKPGGYSFTWALPRVSHWTAMALEDAGWELRDVHHDVLVLDEAAREFVDSLSKSQRGALDRLLEGVAPPTLFYHLFGTGMPKGLSTKTTLKPAVEHWILARKPLAGTVADNEARYGTGRLGIEACRVGDGRESEGARVGEASSDRRYASDARDWHPTGGARGGSPLGRWPAHLSLDEHAAAELDAQAGPRCSGGALAGTPRGVNAVYSKAPSSPAFREDIAASVGGASRFFYVAKPSKAERSTDGEVPNDHATVKSIALMRWLVRLVCPPGGTVLDSFAGSGTTGVACALEGRGFVGIEKDEEGKGYVATARERIRIAELQTSLALGGATAETLRRLGLCR